MVLVPFAKDAQIIAQGEVIFWQFQNYNPLDALFIGNQFANVSGYSLEPTPFNSSFAGFKDCAPSLNAHSG